MADALTRRAEVDRRPEATRAHGRRSESGGTGDHIQPTAQPARPRRQYQAQPCGERILKRPEAGALGGAILVFVFFWVMAPPFRQFAAFTTVLYQPRRSASRRSRSRLLMIGGEFDLSAGVAVTTSSLAASMFATQVAGSLWAGVVFALVFSLGVGALNGWLLIRTKLPSFLVTLGTFLMLQGLNIAITKLITGNVATQDISGHGRLRHAQDDLRLQPHDRPSADQHRHRLLADLRRGRHLGASAHQESATGSSPSAARATARARSACR